VGWFTTTPGGPPIVSAEAKTTYKEKNAMKKTIACLALLVTAGVTPMFAAPDIVYVSFLGADGYPCTRIAPCKTITHGLSVAPAGGKVDIIGSGTYDNFTVTQSVTVSAEPGVLADLDVPASANGITINAGSSDIVVLRGLTIHGHGSGNGIQVNSAGRLVVEECISRNFYQALVFTPSTPGMLTVKGGTFEANGSSIFICCASGGTAANVDIAGITAVFVGVSPYIIGGINVDATLVTITHSVFTGPGAVGNYSKGIAVPHGTAVIENNSISGFWSGVFVYDTAYLSSNTITGNSFGVNLVNINGTCFSRGNNTNAANGTNVSGTLTPFSPL
jgi:hypothetical protein